MSRRIRLRPTAVYTPPETPPPDPGFDGPAELPRTYIDTTYALPAGNVWTATNTSDNNAAGTGTGNRTGCGFQYALTNSQPGDVIQLTNGATYTGKFNCPNKGAGSDWIYIVPSDMSFLPSPTTSTTTVGSPIVPATHAASMPILQHPSTVNYDFEPIVGASAGANHYRFVGIRFRPTYTQGRLLWSLVWLGRNSSTGNRWSNASDLPSHFTFDRCYIHGYSEYHLICGLRLDGNYMAVVDCYFDEIKSGANDCQAINVINGYGPFRISHNRLRATSEIIIFGGAGIPITDLLPSDIHIYNNDFSWDPAWFGGTIPFWNGTSIETRGLNLKNHLEVKTGDRVLIERNKFTTAWTEDQQGQAIYITDGDESAPDWSTTRDVTVRYNRAEDVGTGFMIGSNVFLQPNITPPTRISCHDNLFICDDIGTFRTAAFRFTGEISEISFRHNTCIVTNTSQTYAAAIFDTKDNPPTTPRNVGDVVDNIFVARLSLYYFGANNSTWFAGNWAGSTFTKNVFIGDNANSSANWPTGNFLNYSATYQANVSAVGFVDFAGGNYRLSGASAYKGAATDGLDIGANIDLVPA